MTAAENPVRQPSLLDALVPMAALIGLLALSYMFFGDGASSGPNQFALMTCSVIAAGIAFKNGVPWDDIRKAIVEGVSAGLPAILILLAVGALIGAWAMCGTIVAMVYYGLKFLSPSYFYATTALFCAAVGFSIGSSWTVAGTIGVGLMGIAGSMGLSPEITAGAIISGAYFGDKASPLSGSVNLVTATAGSDIFDQIRESLWISLPCLAAAAMLFGMLAEPREFDPSNMLADLSAKVMISPWAFLPLVIVLGLSLARMPAFVTIFAGALVGAAQAVMLDPSRVIAFAAAPELPSPLAALKGTWSAMANGYSTSTGDASIDAILSRGGMASMMVTVWLIIAALSFGAIVERAGLLNRLIDPIIGRIRSTTALIATLVGTSLSANVVTSDQYMAIALAGRLFRPIFGQRGLAPVMLSRVVGDSATVTSPLIPWNSCGAYMSATLGVATTSYGAFCFFNLLNPVVTILATALGFRVLTAERVRSAAKG